MLAAGQALSWLGDGFQTVALAVAVVLSGAGAAGLGLVMAVGIVARLACTLIGGVWADRLQPQRVMVGADLVRCAAAAGMAVMFAQRPSLVAPALRARRGLRWRGGLLLPRHVVAEADAGCRSSSASRRTPLLSMLQTACSVLGPAAGGLVVAAVRSAGSAFAANAAELPGVGRHRRAHPHARRAFRAAGGMLSELVEGWQEIRCRDWLLSGVLAATVYHVANGVILVLVQVIAVERLGGAGAVRRHRRGRGPRRRHRRRGRPARAAPAPAARRWLALLLMPVWAMGYVWPGVLAAVLVGAVLGYAGLLFFSVAWETAIQDHVPHRVLARVSSWDILTSFIGMPLGNALAGPLADPFGLEPGPGGLRRVLLAAALAPLSVTGTRALQRQFPLPVTSAHAVTAKAANSAG